MTTNPNDLIDSYLDGELAGEDVRRLRSWLGAAPGNLDAFMRRCQLHWALHELLASWPIRDRTSLLTDGTPEPRLEDIDDDAMADSEVVAYDSLADAMVMPALRLADDPDEPAPRVVPMMAPVPRRRPAGRFGRWRLMAGGVAAVVAIVTTSLWVTRYGDPAPSLPVAQGPVGASRPDEPSPVDRAVSAEAGPASPKPPTPRIEIPAAAHVVAAFEARWAEGDATVPAGGIGPLRQGTSRLEAGLIRLGLAGGAEVIVEGPTTFSVADGGTVVLTHGRLTARVAGRAAGFAVRTPAALVVDSGTEFGVAVDAAGGTELHMYEGEADLTPRNGSVTAIRVAAGNGKRVDAAGTTIAETPHDRADFVRPREFDQLTRAANDIAYGRWLADRLRIRRDPTLLAYYTFEPEAGADQVLRNESRAGSAHDGAIDGATWAQGRWPQKQALAFAAPGDEVRLAIPGRHETLTVAAWVRIDELANSITAILNADATADDAAHLQIRSDGRVSFNVGDSIANSEAGVFVPSSPPAWRHVAGVYSLADRTVKVFLDGAPVATGELAGASPARLGEARIGRWERGAADTEHPDRSLKGRIDELAVWRRALSNEEVRALARPIGQR